MTGPPHSGSNNVVYRGGNAYIQFDSKAYKAGSVAAFWPWSSLGTMGTIGVLASSIALGMILSATVGTPAFGFPATLTAPYSILAPNNPARLLFDSRVRNVPVRLLCLPYSSGGIKWYQ